MLADCTALAASALGAILLWPLTGAHLPASDYAGLWFVIGLYLLAYAAAGLYPAVAVHPAEELRRVSMATSTVFPLLGVLLFISKQSLSYSRGAYIVAWIFALFTVPAGRMVARLLFSTKSWWGYPVVVLSAAQAGLPLVRQLVSKPEYGLKPVALFDEDCLESSVGDGVPVSRWLDTAPVIAADAGIQHAVIALPQKDSSASRELIERYAARFPHVVVVPSFEGFSTLWAQATDLGGTLGLEVRQRLLLPVPRLTKALLDFGLCVAAGAVVLPLVAVIALLVRCTSRGPVFYSQQRIGRDGCTFQAWKFRTMVQDADAILERHLADNPELRAEWTRTHKLRNDPRVTSVGRVLRRTSLDELPQLWNVMRREMSLVGPRPIVSAEVVHYGDSFRLMKQVLPGITGLWQVSGRSDTSYAERVRLDAYYIRNWSPWLDIYILARTIGVVMRQQGAY
jgi:Undecaprenyl-phosphate galactose phosphotransferase WbaP